MNKFGIDFGKPVLDNRFVGRSHEVDWIIDSLIAGQSVSMYGLHRIGKTSIAKNIERKIKEIDSSICVSYVEVHNQDTERLLWIGLAEAMEFRDEVVQSMEQSDNFYRVFKREFRSLSINNATSGRRCVWILDELDRVIDSPNANDILNKIREFSYNPDNCLAILFVSARDLSTIQGRIPGSNLEGICGAIVSVCPFKTTNEIKELLVSGEVSDDFLNETILQKLQEISGGHPYLLNYLLKEMDFSTVSVETMIDTIEQIFARESTFVVCYVFDPIVKHLKEVRLWDTFLDLLFGPYANSNVEIGKKCALQSMGLDPSCREKSPFVFGPFHSYTRQLLWTEPRKDDIANCEIALRKLIVRLESKEHGAGWRQHLEQLDGEVGNVLRSAEDRLHRDQRRYPAGNISEDQLLEYSNFTDILLVIAKDWGIFQSALHDSLNHFRELMLSIVPLRNGFGHSRPLPLSDSEYRAGLQACQTILGYINEAEQKNLLGE